MRRTAWPWAAAAVLALALAAGAAWAREPLVRKIDPATDWRAVLRIEARRSILPLRFQRRNNFAWAIVRIEGVDRQEFIAHSGIQDINDIPVENVFPEGLVSFKPSRGSYHFTPLAVNEFNVVEGPDSWYRDIDTEFKILEDLARRIPSTNATGRIHMYTQLHPCASCYHVMCEFLDRYPNITLQVLYKEPYP